MKYWNKDRDVRHRCWTQVQRPYGRSSEVMKLWCQHHPSTGKFYYFYAADAWWFERSEDATLFLLRWQ